MGKKLAIISSLLPMTEWHATKGREGGKGREKLHLYLPYLSYLSYLPYLS